MKFILITLFLFLSGVQLAHAQRSIDSLTKLLAHSGEDTNKVSLLIELAANYQFSASDTALELTDEAIQLARKIKYDKGEIRAISRQGEVRHLRGEQEGSWHGRDGASLGVCRGCRVGARFLRRHVLGLPQRHLQRRQSNLGRAARRRRDPREARALRNRRGVHRGVDVVLLFL